VGVETIDLAPEGALEDLRDPQTVGSVVALARQIDEARDEALERIAPHEQRRALAILQVQDAGGDAHQFVFLGLKKLGARKAVEHVLELTRRVATLSQLRSRHHLRDPPA
jgi:hypothetical protein